MQENKEYEKHEVIENFLAGDSFSDEDLDHNINGGRLTLPASDNIKLSLLKVNTYVNKSPLTVVRLTYAII